MQLIQNHLKYNEFLDFLKKIDNSFSPKLSEQTTLSEYAKKLIKNGYIITAIIDNKIAGLIAGYINNELTKEAFISLVYVDKKYRRQNIASNLMRAFIDKTKEKKFKIISLECNKTNTNALSFYQKFNFQIINNTHPIKLKLNKQLQENKILVSICCVTYNHEKYIKKCIDGFLMQKTNFNFEVLIYDDASTDKTAEIIKEYQQKYPDIIKPIFQKENQFSKGISISKTFNFQRIKGKYVALCEGDDYWIAPHKLQKQVDFLEENPNYSICFHPVKIIYEDRKKKPQIFPSQNKKFTFENLQKANFIQTNSVMYKWIKPEIPDNITPYDWYYNLLHAKIGEIGFINEVMSVYRKHTNGIWHDTSFAASNLHRKYGLKEIKFYFNVYKKITNYSEEYLNSILLPNFKQILDNYYSFGDIDKLTEIKSLYPGIYEKSLQIQNPIDKKIKKYKKMYSLFILISIILLIINIIQLFV